MRSRSTQNVRQLNSLATRHMELLGVTKNRSPAYIPKQLLAGHHKRQASDTPLIPLCKTPPRGVLVKGCTVTTEYKFKRQSSHPLFPRRKQQLLTRQHTSKLLKRPLFRVRLCKAPRPRREDVQASGLTPWSFSDKHEKLSTTWT